MTVYNLQEVSNSFLELQSKAGFLKITNVELLPNGPQKNVGRALAFYGFVGVVKDQKILLFINQLPQNKINLFNFSININEIDLVCQTSDTQLVVYIQKNLVPLTFCCPPSQNSLLIKIFRSFNIKFCQDLK
ncbi:hypothetical protein SS50377_27317 [Spironucleus salmonicida]|uniref:Uncharacterized protein n=1 Tax=Spironucleus salmonicida TaxID=348837 RepID=A0A9P8LMR6_9EUKA|nr:hypothetical protein SS50377_27317 [Spironucleus salmonicida]